MNDTLTAVEGIRVGHATHTTAQTGCTVVLCPERTIGGVDQRGGAPGTRETDLLRPMHLVEHVHAIVLSGGSAFGLATADGVMRYLREQDIGYPTGSGVHIPIVPAAILYDLETGDAVWPDADMGYAAAAGASDAPVETGRVGSGAGCRVGKVGGPDRATNTGLGSASVTLENGLVVAALVAVNALGDVVDESGNVLAGLRTEMGDNFAGTLNALREMSTAFTSNNTVIGVVATNAQLTKEMTNRVATMAHDGLARAVRPAHTLYDGDTIFSLATGQVKADVNLVGALAAEVFAEAIRNGARL